MSGGMSRLVRSAIRGGLATLGYELRRKPRGHVWGVDAYADQVELLRGTTVRMIFDVGANIGQTTAIYRNLFPDAVIHAFEPFNDSYRVLNATFSGCPKVVPHQCAIAERTGQATLYSNRSHYTNSLLAPSPSVADYVGEGLIETVDQIVVSSLSLDDFCSLNTLDQVDVLKIDVQGCEGMVLEGARRLLEMQSFRLIYSEVQLAPMYVGQSTLWDLHRLLQPHGYRLFGLYQLVHAASRGLAWADAIFLPEEYWLHQGLG